MARADYSRSRRDDLRSRRAQLAARTEAEREAVELEEIALLEADIAERASRDLRLFVRRAWQEIDPAPYIHNWHVDCLCDHLMAVSRGEIQYLNINIPPGFSKSLIVSVFWPAWEWTTRPHLQYQAATHNQELATRDSVRCRDLILSDWYQRHYDVELKGDANGKTLFFNTAKGWRRTATPGGKSTGWRSHRLIIDDLISAKEAHSDAKRAAANSWLTSEFWNRRHEVSRDAVVMISQRLHEDDPTGHVAAKMGDARWEHVVLPNRYDPARSRITWSGWDDPRTEPGQYIHEARHGDAEDDEARRALGEAGYAAQHDQAPRPKGGHILNPDRIGRYMLPPPEEARSCSRVVLSVDCAFRATDGSDYVCVLVLGQRGSEVLVLDEVLERMGFSRTCEVITSVRNRWAPLCPGGMSAVVIEGKANGDAVVDALKRSISGLVVADPLGGKIARAHAVTPTVDAGNVLLPADYLGVRFTDPTGKEDGGLTSRQKAERYGTFPKLGNDDDVDALTQGLAFLTRGAAPFGWSFGPPS